MSSLTLFDLTFGARGSEESSEALRSCSARVAARLIDSLLGELHYLRDLDSAVVAARSDKGFDPAAAVLLRAQYEEWARNAADAIKRVKRIQDNHRDVTHFDELLDEQARVMAMLDVSEEQIEQGREQIRQNKLHGREEVRRELHLGAK